MISRWSMPRKPQRKPKPRPSLTLRLIGEAGVVEPQLAEGLAQVLEIVVVDRVEAAEDHRLRLLVAGQRPRSVGLQGVGDGVADVDVAEAS